MRRGSRSGAMRPGLLSHRDGPQGNATVTEAAAASIGGGEELSLLSPRESLRQQQQQLADGEGGALATAAEEAVDLPRRISGTGVAPPAAAGVVAVPDHRALFQRVFNGKSLYKLTDMEGQ